MEKNKKNYPLAFKLLIDEHLTYIKWSEIDSPTIWGDFVNEEHYILRHLYDFFDNNNIYMNIFILSKNKWKYYILIENNNIITIKYSTHKSYKTRELSELDVFINAFDILNNKLKDN